MVNLKTKVLLKDYTNYKIGGPAKFFFNAKNKEDLVEGMRKWKEFKPENYVFILGGGTNLLINDFGFNGLIIHNGIKGTEMIDGEKVKVGSGVMVSDFLDFCIENSLSGFDWAGGLPGTIGGAVRGNAGAFKGETKDSIISVTSLNLDTLEEIKRSNKECLFGYRNSIFKSSSSQKEFITEVVLKLKKGKKEEIKKNIQEKIIYRKNRHPLDYPNAGSTFKNVPFDKIPKEYKDRFEPMIKNDPFAVVPVVKILLECDLWEKRVGGAKFSDKHPNFIVNTNNAKAADVKALINMAKEKVKDKFGILLEEEIMFVGF